MACGENACGADLPSCWRHPSSDMVTEAMFLRAKIRKKDGKQHRYFSVVENRRVGQNKTAQRTVLYLGGDQRWSGSELAQDAAGFRRESAATHHAELVPRGPRNSGRIERQYPSQTERDGIASATGFRQLLAGV